jgi:hypothetical protein
MRREDLNFSGWMDDEFEVYDIDDFNPSGPRNFEDDQPHEYNQQWDEPFDF